MENALSDNKQRDEALWDLNARRRELFGCTTEELCGALRTYGLVGYEPTMVKAKLVESIIRHENALRIEKPLGIEANLGTFITTEEALGCSEEGIEAGAARQRAEEAEASLVARVEALERKVAALCNYAKTDIAS